MSEATETIQDILETLKEEGFEATIRQTDGTYDTAAREFTDKVAQTFTVHAIKRSARKFVKEGSAVRVTDSLLLVGPEDGYKPKLDDVVIMPSGTAKVIEFETVAPADISLLHRLFVRS